MIELPVLSHGADRDETKELIVLGEFPRGA